MPQQVDFDGMGVIEFPDEMGRDEIAKILTEHGDEIKQRFGAPPGPDSKDFNRVVMPQAEDPNPPPIIGKAPPPSGIDTLQPWNFVPQSEVAKPEESKVDQENVRKIHAYYDDLMDLVGPNQPEKYAALQQARNEALKQQGVGVVDFLSTAHTPRLDADSLKTIGLPDTLAKVSAGLQNAVAGSTDFFLSPEGMAVLGSGNLPEGLRRAVSASFAVDMATSEPRLIAELAKAWKEGDTQKATELAVNATLNVAFAKESAKHAMTPEGMAARDAMVKGLAKNIQPPGLFSEKITMPTKGAEPITPMVREALPLASKAVDDLQGKGKESVTKLPTPVPELEVPKEVKPNVEIEKEKEVLKPETPAPVQPGREVSTIPDEEVGSVYKGPWRGGEKWFVQTGENRGFGDEIHDTEDVANKSAEILKRNAASRAETLQKIEADKAAETKAKSEREDLDGFGSDLPPMKRGAIAKQLTANLNYGGELLTRRDLIRKLVNEGRAIETDTDGTRMLIDKDEKFLGEKVLTKAGMDYAQFLIDRKASESNTIPENAPPTKAPDDVGGAGVVAGETAVPKEEFPAPPKGVGIPPEQWADMAKLNTKEQLEKYGTTRAKEMERVALEAQAKREQERVGPKSKIGSKVEDWLEVPERDNIKVRDAQIMVKDAAENLAVLNKRNIEIGDKIKALLPKVTYTAGPRYKRGNIKESAKQSDKIEYQSLLRQRREIEDRIQASNESVRGDHKVLLMDKLANTVMDTSKPLLARLDARVRMFDERGVEPDQSLLDFRQAEALKELRKIYPDATDAELKPMVQRAAINAEDLRHAAKLDPDLNLYGKRRGEISTVLEEGGYGSLREFFPDELNARIEEADTKRKPYSGSIQPPLKDFTRAETDKLISDIKKEIPKAKKESERQSAEAAAEAEAAKETARQHVRDVMLGKVEPEEKIKKENIPQEAVEVEPIAPPPVKAGKDILASLKNIASNDAGRDAVSGVRIAMEGDKKVAIATDGRQLVRVPYSGPLQSGTHSVGYNGRKKGELIPLDYPNYKQVIPDTKGFGSLPLTDTMAARINGAYAKSKLIPEPVNVVFEATVKGKPVRVVLDSEYAAQSMMALRANGVREIVIRVSDYDKPVVFEDKANPSTMAVIMPKRLDADSIFRVEANPNKTYSMATSAPPAPGPTAPLKPVAKPTLPAPWPVAKPSTGLPFASTMVQALKSIRSVLAPQNLGHDARIFSLILRENNAQMALDLVRADAVLSDYRKLFDRTPVPKDWIYDPAQPLPNNYSVIDALERNRSALPTELQSMAQRFDDEFAWRIAEVQKLNPDALQKLIKDYFPHMWEQPERGAASFMAEVAARSPLHGSKAFLKQRSIDFFHEGLARGLKPISDNPVDLLLAKMHQMDKFIMAQRTLQEAKGAGMYKYLPLGREMPDGWVTVKDPHFTVFAPPVVTMREAFDLGIRTGLLDFIKKMGFTHERVTKVGKVNTWGQYTTGGKIESKFGGPDFVIMHEIGHGLDERYGLYNQLSTNATLKGELKALADERSAGQTTSQAFKKYAQDPAEQIANVVHAYMYAPELMDKVAPNVKKAFEGFIQTHPELSGLDHIKPSLSLATGQSQFPLAGPVLAGHWIMPEGPAQVLSNYLSPGLQRFWAFRTLRAGSNILNAAQLGLSAFHVGFTSLDAAISSVAVGLHYALEGDAVKGAGKIAAAPFAPLLNYYTGKAVQARMIDPNAKGVKVLGVNVPLKAATEAELGQIAKLAVKGGLRATVDPFWQTTFTRNMVRAFHEGGAANVGKAAARLPFAMVEQSMRPISEFLVPRQKLGVFAQLAHKEMDRMGPGASVEAVRDAMAKAADTTEDRMGQMTYDNLFYHRIIKDLALVGFRAYGWQLGKYRAIAGAATDTGKFVTGKGELTNRMLYPIALAMVTGTIGGVMNYLLSGKPPEEAKDLFFPKNGQKDASGKDQRYALPTYLKDLASDWKDFPNGAKMAGSFYHKLNPGIAMAVDMLRNRDFYDTEIRHPDDPVSEQLWEEAQFLGKSALPFSVSGYNKLGETDTPELQRLLPFIGIVPAKKSLTMTPAESRAAEIMQALMPAGSRTKEQFEKSQFKGKLLRDIQANEADGRQKIQLAVQGGAVTPQEAQQILGRKDMTPLQYQVKKMPSDKAMQVWDLANDSEKDSLRALLRIKVAGSSTIKPDQKKAWLEVIK